ncbi:hypothetical protein J2755_000373 [Methanohalophilus levihalophilus]|uniref:hypothetical protein n=1 Tax=Methanohalophilus levihalophilus TaxID=1431282 RepID=UPI001AE799E6|nr:hypothetical protein [Methanohalophilus levihalophilus]MBP2029453.1 hypothetical protein [Methanohalophilus levihalophilus]
MTGYISIENRYEEDWKEARAFLYEIRYMILFYVLGDFLSTYWALNYGFEQNGFLALAMEHFGIGILFIFKMIFILFAYWTYRQLRDSDMKERDTIWNYSKNAITFAGAFLVVNNMMVVVARISLTDLVTLAMM